MKNILDFVLKKLGKRDYKVSRDLSSKMIVSLFTYRAMDFFRGLIMYPRLKKAKLPIFRGPGGRIFFPEKIEVLQTLNIGSNVVINALCREKVKIGKNFTIKSNSIIDCTGVLSNLGEGLQIGNDVGVSENCFIQVRGRVEIGDNVIIGPGASIFSENHNFGNDSAVKNQGVTRKGVKINDGCWLGANSIILDGVSLGKNCVVGAGSVVTKSFEDDSVIVGTPARKIND